MVFLKGHKVSLRSLSVNDAPTVSTWVNDPEVAHFTLRDKPSSVEEERDRIETHNKSDRDFVFGIETDSKLIGLIGLHKVHWNDGVGMTVTIIGDKENWGKGFGTDAKMTLLEYAFNTLNLRKIYAGVVAFNEQAIQYNKNCGYKVEGVRKEHVFRDGKYWDMVDMAIFKKDWLKLKQTA